MATITTPGAGVSPYQAVAAAPTVLRAAADGTTVLATAAAAAATVSELAAANANTLVVVTGPAALNSLITTSQPGVFEGANVTINLEEQNFSTTNQVTSNTNYPEGGIGEIQFNSGSNSFASNAYFTYDNSNVITPGIRTDGYFYSNGAPFIGGGNAAIGNFVFTGDTMTISDSNQNMNITGNGTGNIQVNSNGNIWTFNNSGNLAFPTGMTIDNEGANTRISQNEGQLKITAGTSNASLKVGWSELEGTGTGNVAQIIANGTGQGSPGNLTVFTGNQSSTTYSWTFGNDGNLTLPANSFAVNYANGNPVVISGGAAGLPLANGTSNINIATANGNVTITANGSPTWTFKSDGNLTLPTAGNIVGAVNIIGNGTGNVNVIANSRAWTFAADGNLVLPLAGNIVNYGNTWNFGYNGILTLPGNSRVAPVGANIEIQAAAGGYAEIVTSDGNSYVAVTTSGAEIVTSGVYTWAFNNVGNLTLPGNTFAVNYANGNPVSIANTGNVTFSSEIVIGTGTSNLISGLYLAPSSSSANANMYLRVRGNIVDEPTHIHFDTGNNAYYNQFIGDDNKYIQLANTGNIVINSNNGAGNAAQWNFSADGNLNLPNSAVIKDTAGDAVAFGQFAGNTGQGLQAVAIGLYAGTTTQGQYSVAIGGSAGATSQGQESVAVGVNSGATAQGIGAVSIGASSGASSQGNTSVAIGTSSGALSQGANAVAIGYQAGYQSQGNNSIILNATGAALNQTTANTFTVKPVRGNSTANLVSGGFKAVYYNSSTGEFAYSTD